MSARALCISTAGKINSAVWRQELITWQQLCSQLQVTHRTRETHAEFLRMSRADQSSIKDVGGFVGGRLQGGKRTKEAVECRSVLTLDLDSARPDMWAELTCMEDWCCCIYSTHKHSPEAPRLRLVAPLARDVSAEEYVAISRLIASDLGIEQVDPCSFRPTQVMYWPSTSSDGQWVYEEQDGPWLDPDEVLSRYKDWHDISSYPLVPGEKSLHAPTSKAEDPCSKPGIIGAWCRAYPVSEAIETYLPEIYEEVAPGRYTYSGGSTTGGLVVYDDLWAYSWHATDPVSGLLVNSFDLVRIHLYGNLDKQDQYDKITNAPSYKAMVKLAMSDSRVQAEQQAAAADKQQKKMEELFGPMEQEAALPAEAPAPQQMMSLEAYTSANWLSELVYDKDKGVLLQHRDNIIRILVNDPHLAGFGGYSELGMCHQLSGPVPWDARATRGQSATDADLAGLRTYLEMVYGITAKQQIEDAVELVLSWRSFHPVRDYLNSLTWDGVERLDTLLVKCFGAQDSEYMRAITRKTLCAAVARAYKPGCQADYVLVLQGPQGIRKSTWIRELFGAAWTGASLESWDAKQSLEQTQGKWAIELPELSALSKADFNSVKNFVTRVEDQSRAAYAAKPRAVKRSYIMIGTTNDDTPLRDETGARRWWMAPVHQYMDDEKLEWLRESRDQLWAEAVVRYKEGEKLYLTGEAAKEAVELQSGATVEDGRLGEIMAYLEMPIPVEWYKLSKTERYEIAQGINMHSRPTSGWRRDVISAKELLWELYHKELSGAQLKSESAQINNLLKQIPGWHKAQGLTRIDCFYGPQRVYVRDGGAHDGGPEVPIN